MWLEDLAPEARSHKTWLLTGWVNAAEALRSAVHAHESERGPLVEALFPAWRGASLRRHADQALAAETELQRRLASGYVVRRLAELSTRSAVGPALEALAAAGTAWAAERDRPALAGAQADEVTDRLVAAARESAQLLERVRWLVRAALARRPDLLETVFPKRAHSAGRDAASSGVGATDEASGAPVGRGPGDDVSDGATSTDAVAGPEEGRENAASGGPSSAVVADVPEGTRRRASGRKHTEEDAMQVAPSTPEPARQRVAATRRRTVTAPTADAPTRRSRVGATGRGSAPARPEPTADARPARVGVTRGQPVSAPPEPVPHADAARRRSATAHREPATDEHPPRPEGTRRRAAASHREPATQEHPPRATQRRSAAAHPEPAPPGPTARADRRKSRRPRRS